MAVTKNLMVRAGADFSAITTQSKKASASMKSMGNAAASAGSMMRKAFGALGLVAAIRMIASAAKDAAEAYKEDAIAEAKLAQTMKNTMRASSEEIKAIKDLCSAQQELGVIGDDVTMAGAQQLATFTRQSATLKKLIPSMNDMIAAQYGFEASQESAASVAKMLGKAMNGQTTSLAKLGFQFTDAQKKIMQYGTEEQRAATLADVVSAHVGGMNAALANTPVGRMQQLRNTMGDIKESFGQAVTTIGTVFLPLLNRVASMLASIAAWANRVAQAIANVFGKKLTPSTSAVAAGAGSAADSFEDMEKAAQGAGSAAKEAARSVLSFDVLNKLSDNSSASGSGSGSQAAAAGGGDTLGGFSMEEDEAAESSTKLEKALQRVKDLIASINFEPLRAAAARVREAFSGLADVIGGALSWAFDNVLAPLAHWTIEDALPAGLNLFAEAIDFVRAAVEAASPLLKKLWDDFLQPVAKWVGDKFVDTLNRLSEILGNLTDVLEGNTSFKEFLDTLTPMEELLGGVGIGALAVFAGMTLVSGVFKTISTTVGLVTSAFTLLTNPITWVVIAIGAAIAIGVELYKNWDTVKEKISAAWDNIKEKFAQGKQELQTDIENIKAYFAGLSAKWEGIKAAISEKWDALKEKFNEGRDAINGVIKSIKSFFEGLKTKWESIKTSISEKIDELKQKWEDFKEKFGAVKDAVVSFAESLLAGVTAPFSSIVSLVDGISSACSTAVSWVQSVLGAGGYADQFYESNIAAGGGLWNGIYASGGWPSVGEIFVAREAGPEMVGTIGGNTAVANNDDIVEAVSRGVATAVAQVLNSGGRKNNGGFVLNVNGKEFVRAIYSDMQSVTSERGISLVNA